MSRDGHSLFSFLESPVLPLVMAPHVGLGGVGAASARRDSENPQGSTWILEVAATSGALHLE